ncbi:ABC transporter ATP-binding protein [Chelatococcus asaccharovorans]|uniref:ABC transporter ATP-binding protein n=1 Tax=Chelatococcus asaccharovorans TaxID=28210 RepID=UPI00224C7073|nr:ABC transporter ATP-binding protein [Chelatococcus asaccharovorans]CAH1666060.1 branched chain amino acid/phenylalanine ABC transporter ATP binding subunit LivG [Chelatococcus asaccharovorans]CAH1681651.1 branched chain amino acid/phenylalanine ABC transporter ATP binding subunit LivG [Chelatococcus asaccharovorans]
MSTPLLDVSGIGIAFGGVRAVDEVSFKVAPGEVFSIIGPNGAGKTTLFNLVTGIYRPSRGTVRLDGADITAVPPHLRVRSGMARTFQNLQIFFRMTAVENVMVGCALSERTSFLADLLGLPSVFRQNRVTRAKALALLERVGLADLAEAPAGALPYGALKRLEIARALAADPKVLLLDEPAAGCNAVETEAIDNLIAAVAKSGVAVVLIEHDMKLVMKISDRVLVLAQGRPLAEGPPRAVRENPQVIAAYLGDIGSREADRAHG